MTLETLLNYVWSLEGLSALFSIIYLILAIKQNIWCWFFGIIGTAIFCYLMWQSKLYMEAALQIFYIAISFYGIWQWRYHGKKLATKQKALKVSSWNIHQHLVAIGIILGLAVGSGHLLNTYTDAAKPFIDSFTTWGGVIATYMVAKKVFENWHYWFVIDSVLVYLMYDRGYYIYALLYCIYLVLIVFGYFAWKKEFNNELVNST